MTDTHIDNAPQGSAASDFDEDEDVRALKEGLQKLGELKDFHSSAAADLEAAQLAGADRIAALQAEIDAETGRLATEANEAAIEFNNARDELIELGHSTAKRLNPKGFGKIPVTREKSED
ncbi:Uncharacterised protein (plasmid) [Tsukamurella tyrosinosolvens]|uniref:Uncharacterized protein n=1 Tax=Tsukamurella tyrosinosolvens TaxID=57704 RepID=A0A1H4VVQ5_TSUTY|nr:hypothetical protein [Tsukamurella tyrosinosolvens]KXO90616.1 hypothetical protein AXK58_22870 [Tsukamurella tyrosinosolvens]SEC84344.1 hypothetical protein SAMN04489793_3333 [Tsukamurella tyrosinosolvens]VEH90303.1 Uncharacterised protein [Tsukamurella tyrosinosolvens]